MKHLILIGFMGSGKGSIASSLSKYLGVPSVDLDKRISERMKMTSAEIYSRYGETYYRAMEMLIMDEWTSIRDKRVFVLGSGALTLPENIALTEKLGRAYYIRRAPETLIRNMKKSDKKHAWIRGDEWENQVRRLYSEREEGYVTAADVVIDADGKSADEIVALILQDFAEQVEDA